MSEDRRYSFRSAARYRRAAGSASHDPIDAGLRQALRCDLNQSNTEAMPGNMQPQPTPARRLEEETRVSHA